MTEVLGSGRQHSFSRLVGRSALLLAIASGAFIIPGMIRTKLSAVYFGEPGIALFGQLSQLQTLLISIGAAGLVTATRVVLSRPQNTSDQGARLLSWCLWTPFLGSLVLAGFFALVGSAISGLVLGSTSYGVEVALASLGIPFAVAGQISIAGAQARGKRGVLVIAAAGSAVVGSFAVWALMSLGDQRLGAVSFVAAPMIQLLFVLAVCAPVRRSVFRVPWINRQIFKEIFVIAWASALLAVCASAAELLSRTLIVQTHGLASLAAYQPVATLVTQLVSIALSALATASLVELSQVQDRLQLGRIVTNLEKKFIPLMGLVCGLLLSASPILVASFFNDSLWLVAYPLMVVSLAFEPVRAAVWLAGSAFLPNGMRMAWLVNGLVTVLAQVLLVVMLSPAVGVISLSLGFAFANVVSLVMTLALLRRKGIVVGRSALVTPLIFAGLLVVFGLWDMKLLNAVVAGPLLYAVLLGLFILLMRWRQRGRVESEDYSVASNAQSDERTYA